MNTKYYVVIAGSGAILAERQDRRQAELCFVHNAGKLIAPIMLVEVTEDQTETVLAREGQMTPYDRGYDGLEFKERK